MDETEREYCSVTGKRIYRTREEAVQNAAFRVRKGHLAGLRIYPCPFCNALHLTKTKLGHR